MSVDAHEDVSPKVAAILGAYGNKGLAIMVLLPEGDPKEVGISGSEVYKKAHASRFINPKQEAKRLIDNRVQVNLQLLKGHGLVAIHKLGNNLGLWALTKKGAEQIRSIGANPAPPGSPSQYAQPPVQKKRRDQGQGHKNGSTTAAESSKPTVMLMLADADAGAKPWDTLTRAAAEALGQGQFTLEALIAKMLELAPSLYLDMRGVSSQTFRAQAHAAVTRLNFWAKKAPAA